MQDTRTAALTAKVRTLAESALKVHDDILQQSAFYRIPVVPKGITVGRRGGVFYINQRGRRVYLKQRQLEKWKLGHLRGCVRNCKGTRKRISSASLRSHLRKIRA